MTFISVCCWDRLPMSSSSLLSYFYFLTATGFQREAAGWPSARISLNIHLCLLNKKKINCFVVTSWTPLDGENSHISRLLIRGSPTHLTFLPNILVNDQHWLDHIALEITLEKKFFILFWTCVFWISSGCKI